MVARTRNLAGPGLLLGAAGGGALLALGGAALAGGLGEKTTTVHETQGMSPVVRPARLRSVLSVGDIYRRSAPGVVQVTSLGSGFVVDKAGHIVTSHNVIHRAGSVRVSFSNGASMTATVVGIDPSSGLAVLRISASSRALTPLPLGNSDGAKVGDPVVAIGNPHGLERTATAGIVSAIRRSDATQDGSAMDRLIETDAAVDHGSLGGPLLNAVGEVIGVNSQDDEGASVAVPSNTVKVVLAQLLRHGRVDRASIGLSAVAITRDLARVFHLPVTHGLLVQSVEAGSGAAQAGVQAGTSQVVLAGEAYKLGGDTLVAADGVAVTSPERLRDVVAARKPGDSVRLLVMRGGKRLALVVKLGRQAGTG